MKFMHVLSRFTDVEDGVLLVQGEFFLILGENIKESAKV